MMYFDVKPVGELIKEFYEQHRGSDYLDEVKVVNSWPMVVGPFIASHTIDLSIKDGVMKWKALRMREDGSTYTATFELKKVE